MIAMALLIAEWLLMAAALAATARLAIGPGLANRVVALDLLSVLLVGFLSVHASRTGQWVLVDVALVIGLIAFLATVAFGVFLETSRRADQIAERSDGEGGAA